MGTLGDLGEFAFIDRIAGLIPSAPDAVLGIGDDCAVLKVGGGLLLVSCDLSIENIHFRRGAVAPEDIGWKAAASALSDIAAMGGVPRFAVVALAAPPDTDAEELEAIYRGMLEAASACGAAIVGGDTTRSEQGITIDVTVLGEAPDGRYLARSGARNGDLLAVTGGPGCSAAGFHALDKGFDAPSLIRAHVRPQPRIAVGRWLCGRDAVHALIDTSDGLTQDAGHLAERSGLGVDIDSGKVPIDGDLAAYCEKNGLDALSFALAGGEDYELAFALDPGNSEEVLAGFGEDFDVPVTVVGAFTDGFEGVRVDGEPPGLLGFDHFGSPGVAD